jgi:hypothetical protein
MTDVNDAVLEALSAHDIDAFMRCYARDARIETGDGESLAAGHEEIRSRFVAMFERFPC